MGIIISELVLNKNNIEIAKKILKYIGRASVNKILKQKIYLEPRPLFFIVYPAIII